MDNKNEKFGYTAIFSGRLGNHMYQYSYVRLLAEEENRPFNLESNLIKATFSLPERSESVADTYKRANGFPFYQNDDCLNFINKYREKVINWFKPSAFGISLLRERDFPPVINIRGGDFLSVGRRLDLKYYHRVSEHLKKKPIIITDDCAYAKSIFDKNEILHTDDDFSVLCHAKELVCSSSTYCWWAAFLGDHDLIVSANEKWATMPRHLSPFVWGIKNIGWSFLDSDGQIKKKLKSN
jgi:hypothetical protein